ncbi:MULTISPECIES: HAMP domain-containing histidine kinase [Cyanophyceae]|uniref:sensor histidine kinase n=1 Tax=Cyanophyceae TaxID=3028117 RepID=UPI0016880BC0|nr:MULTISPECIES: HAMP domain-containing histidine kinase [Cyanophyceae]MBD1917696.1 HAMP domain-containing histidine kinase [Phormidium sp. FACHB-77]MBD2031164.1 HAMP domain-containing histidine kinase [Phormidium sp. FACHB-322]MBD2053593.1 HAMP domain-containing histidine kinase [Leptolyngbya sp. FACHB-60]
MDYPQGQDFTDLKTLQLAYDRLQHQAQHQAAFLGTASHELRSPITQIISLHQLILEDLCESPAEEREFIAQANQAIQTVLKNLDLLVTLSKLDIGALHPRLIPTLLQPLITRVQRMIEMQCINRHCRLIVGPVEANLQVQTDPAWLEQALVMLIEAALAQGSPQISLTVSEDSATGNIALHLGANPGEAPPSAIATLSPEFRYQLAARLAPHLGATLEFLGAAENPKGLLCLQLPRPTN